MKDGCTTLVLLFGGFAVLYVLNLCCFGIGVTVR